MKTANTWGLLVIASVITGCGSDDGASEATSPGMVSPEPAAAAPAVSATARTGTIEIDGQTWTIVPAIQCSVYPGPVVSISGHAAEDEAVAIILDYSPDDGLIAAAVEQSDGSPGWFAMGDQVTFDVDGDHVKGEGRFTWKGAGAAREAQGKFDVQCR